jgi:hypothetical protein
MTKIKGKNDGPGGRNEHYDIGRRKNVNRSGAEFLWITCSVLRLSHDPVSLLLGLRQTRGGSMFHVEMS